MIKKIILIISTIFIFWNCNAQYPILKDINPSTNSSFVNTFTFKLDSNNTLFQAENELGSELWITDGTSEGTSLFLDINAGPNGSIISDMFRFDSLLIFKAQFSTPDSNFIFKYDINNQELVKIFGSSGIGSYPIDISNFGTRIYFKNYENGISHHSYDVVSSTLRVETASPSNKSVLKNNKLYFVDTNKLVELDETYSFNSINSTINSAGISKLFLKGDSIIYINKGNSSHSVKYLPNSITPPINLGFLNVSLSNIKLLEISQNNIIYNSSVLINSPDSVKLSLWGFDLNNFQNNYKGELKVQLENLILFNHLKIQLFNNELYIFTTIPSDSYPFYVWKATNNNVKQFFYRKVGGYTFSSIVYQNYLYFGFTNFFSNWPHFYIKTDGSIENTLRISGGIWNYSTFSNLGFPFLAGEKLLFWAEKNNTGIEPYVYNLQQCEGKKNSSIGSGNWSDPLIWSCGHVPNSNEWVIINSNHRINISTNELIEIKNILVKNGAFFETLNNSRISIQPIMNDY